MATKETAARTVAVEHGIRLTALTIATGLIAAPAWAGSTTIGGDISVDYSLTVNYGLASRTSKQASELINGPITPQGLPSTVNIDDGNRNFNRGSLTANRLSLLGEADIRRGDYGFFTRATGFYDGAYHGTNDNNSPATVNKLGPNNQFTDDTRYYSGQRARFLDAYAYGSFNLGEQSRLNLRLGNQVVQWGESLFFPNIAGAQGPVDATKATQPGIEVKDILLPVGQLSAQLQLNPTVTLLGYYQYKYKATELDPVGSYFSQADVVGPGAQFIRAAPGFNIYRGPDITPSNGGQWGAGARFHVTNDTELGIYRLNYDDKTPNVVTNYASLPFAPFVVPTSYQLKYFDNIKLTGASLATKLGDVSVAGEVSYKQDVPVLVNSIAGPVATRADAVQAQVNFIYLMAPTALTTGTTTFLGELGYLSVGKVQPTTVLGSVANQLTNRADSLGIQLGATPSYPNVFNGWDLSVPIIYAQLINGRAAVAGAFGSLVGQGDKRFSIGVNFKYLSNLELALTYNAFLGKADPVNRPLADRDYVAFNAKYTF
jgi:hypothetical protein